MCKSYQGVLRRGRGRGKPLPWNLRGNAMSGIKTPYNIDKRKWVDGLFAALAIAVAVALAVIIVIVAVVVAHADECRREKS